MRADLVLAGAKVVTMASPNGNCGLSPSLQPWAVALEGERIVAVDSEAHVQPLVDDRTRVLKLQGRTILPGFVDTHVHLMQTGLSLQSPDLSACRTVEEVLERVRQGLEDLPPGLPAFFHRCTLLGLDGPLTRWDLDRVARHRLLAVGDLELNRCVVNSTALDALGLAPGIEGLERLDGQGEPTGLVAGRAHMRARSFFYDVLEEGVRLEALRLACEQALQAGVTTVHAIEGREAFGSRDLPFLLEQRQALPLHLVLYSQNADLKRAAVPGVQGIADLWADGAYVDRSAALREPYADDPTTSGQLNYSLLELEQLAFRANVMGLQVSFHAVGDAAIEQVLSAYERVQRNDPGFAGRRPRIEHFSLASDRQIERAVRLGVGVAMQPAMSAGPQETVSRRLGPERARQRHAYRKMIDAGLLVAGGSDSDVTPICPLDGIHAVANQPVSSRRLSVLEAVSLFTVNGARLACEEELRGTLEPGKLADLVVLGGDPLAVPAAEIGSIPIDMTLVAGRIRWVRPDEDAAWEQVV